MKVEKFDRSNLKVIREILTKSFEKINQETGINLQIGNIKFSEDQFTTKLTANLSENKPKDLKEEWNKSCIFCGLKPEDYNKTFEIQGRTFQIKEINPRHTKYPIIAIEVLNGKKYKFSFNQINGLLK